MMARLALLIGIGLVTAGNYAACAFKSGPNGGVYPTVPGTPGTPGVGTFSSTLTLRNVSGVETQSFVFGEPIRFDFEIINRTNTQQRVQFPDAQTHEFLVANQAATQVLWMWSDGQAFAQVATELVFEPYASKSFTLDLARHTRRWHESQGGQLSGPGRPGVSGLRGRPPGAQRHGVTARGVYGALTIRRLPCTLAGLRLV